MIIFQHTFSIKRHSFIGAFLLVVLSLSACEQLINTDVRPDYEANIVLYGAIVAGEQIDNIRVSRTLPALDSLSAERGALTTASLRLRVDGHEYPMQLQVQRIVNTNGTIAFQDVRSFFGIPQRFIAEEGKTYEIIAEWEGKIARVSTRVPRAATIDSAREIITQSTVQGVSRQEYRYEAVFAPEANTVYQVGALTGKFADTLSATRYGISAVGAPQGQANVGTDGKLRMTSQQAVGVPDRMGVFAAPENPFVVVYSYDAPFADFYNTFTRAFPSSDPFTVGGVNVRWNVTGNGIGIVVGVASQRKRVR